MTSPGVFVIPGILRYLSCYQDIAHILREAKTLRMLKDPAMPIVAILYHQPQSVIKLHTAQVEASRTTGLEKYLCEFSG